MYSTVHHINADQEHLLVLDQREAQSQLGVQAIKHFVVLNKLTTGEIFRGVWRMDLVKNWQVS